MIQINDLYKKEKWLCYITFTKNIATNVERVNKVTDVKENDTLQYVIRSLHLLDEIKAEYENEWSYEFELVKRTLQWSEVSKGGMPIIRKAWRQKGYPLEVHNLASAMIYKECSKDEEAFTKIVTMLIKTHGLIGQAIRGPTSVMRVRYFTFSLSKMH